MTQLIKDREKCPNSENLLWLELDKAFDPNNENEYQKGELIETLKNTFGEGFSRFCDKQLSPHYCVSKSQLNRYVAHFRVASLHFARNPQLRTLLFHHWNMDRAFSSNGHFKPEVDNAIQLCGGIPESGKPESEYSVWIGKFIGTVQVLLKTSRNWPVAKSYGEKVVEETLRLLAPFYPICSKYRYNRSTYFSGNLRYDFLLRANSFSAPYYLIEVQGEQHYRWDYDDTNDKEKKRLARLFGCPLLEIGHWEFCEERDVHYDAHWNMRYIIEPFVASIEEHNTDDDEGDAA